MRKTYEATKNALRYVFRTAAEDVGNDIHELNRQVIVPAVKLGQNRLVSAFAGGKTGFIVGGLAGGPVGLVTGTAVGALVGAVAGPPAMQLVERLIAPAPHAKAANENEEKAEKTGPRPQDPAP